MKNGHVSERDEERGDFLNFSEDLVQLPNIKVAGTSEIDFDGLLDQPLRLHEDLKEGCGGQHWPAGMVLAKYMLRRRRNSLDGKTIVELGAGGGLVGLAVAQACEGYQTPVYITDQGPMLPLMERNIKLNGLQHAAKAVIYDWSNPTPSRLPAKPDIVLAADCVYFEPAFPLLQQTLKDLLGSNTICYFCFRKRRRADLSFIKTVKKMFDVKEVQDDPDETYSKENIYLYKIQKKS